MGWEVFITTISKRPSLLISPSTTSLAISPVSTDKKLGTKKLIPLPENSIKPDDAPRTVFWYNATTSKFPSLSKSPKAILVIDVLGASAKKSLTGAKLTKWCEYSSLKLRESPTFPTLTSNSQLPHPSLLLAAAIPAPEISCKRWTKLSSFPTSQPYSKISWSFQLPIILS